MQIPENISEGLVTFIRLCRNAEEGERLDIIRDRLKDLHPELTENELTEVIQRGARLFVERTDENDPTLARQARKRVNDQKRESDKNT